MPRFCLCCLFATFSVPFSLWSFPLHSWYFISFPLFSYVILSPSINLFCFHFVPSSFLTLLYVSNYRRYISTMGSNKHLLHYVQRYFKVVQVSLSLWCSRTLTRFESLSDHPSAWNKWNILHSFILTMLGLRHSCVQRRWQHSWVETFRSSRIALCSSSSDVYGIRARNQIFVNFTHHPTAHINKFMI